MSLPERLADEVIFSRDHRRAGSSTELYGAVRGGALVRIHPGAYLPADRWSALNVEERHLAQIHAARERYGEIGPFSHLSAAVLWGIPIVNAVPERVSVTMGPTSGGRSRTGIRRHASTRAVESRMRGGLRLTSPARTLVDVAMTQRLSTAVVALDHALREDLVTLEELVGELGPVVRLRGAARARMAVELADRRAETPGESVSRVAIHVLGFESPDLQVEFRDDEGFVARSDFGWRLRRRWIAGEFDGFGKYLRSLDGRDPGSIVVAEKLREDRMRRIDVGVARWGWSEARNLRALERILVAAGVPQRRRFSPTPPEYDRRW